MCWRHAHLSLEGPTERGFGAVADTLRDFGQTGLADPPLPRGVMLVDSRACELAASELMEVLGPSTADTLYAEDPATGACEAMAASPSAPTYTGRSRHWYRLDPRFAGDGKVEICRYHAGGSGRGTLSTNLRVARLSRSARLMPSSVVK
jgi:hypothetical protein